MSQSLNDFALSNLSRRGFLKGVGAAGALVLAATWGMPDAFAEGEKKYGADGMPNGWVDDPKVYVSIDADGSVTVICNRSEMGQGVRTSLSMVVADELEADWALVKVRQAPGDEVRFGNQDTDGSRCGAVARRRGPCWSRRLRSNGTCRPASVGRSCTRWFTARAGANSDTEPCLAVPARDSLRLKQPSEFRYIGKESTRAIDGADIVNGRAVYGADIHFDKMVYATVARPQVYGGKLKSFDAAAALKVPGVLKVVEIEPRPLPSEFQPLGGVAVIASNTWAAIKGREALNIVWDDGDNASYDSIAYRQELEASSRQPGKVVRNTGDVDEALKSADSHFEAGYYLPHLSQSPMEPMVAIARFSDGQCEAWAPTQAPQVTRERIAERLGIGFDKVTVNVSLLGGGFGRKSKPDYVIEAAILAKAMPDTAVRVQWTREDDIHHSYFHTVSAECAEHHGAVCAEHEQRGGVRAGHGFHQHGLQHSQRPPGEPGGEGSHPGRLVPFGVEHSPRLRHPEFCRRTGPQGRAGSTGLSAQVARAGSSDRSPYLE